MLPTTSNGSEKFNCKTGSMSDSAYSAFGSIQPVHDPTGERLRWFCPWLISGPAALKTALNRLAEAEGRVNVSRMTFRVVSDGDLSAECLQVLARGGFQIEATLQIDKPGGRVMSYIGKCSDDRKLLPADAVRERAVLEAIMARSRKGPAAILAEFGRLKEFRLEFVESGELGTADRERLVQMHRGAFPTFPYDFENKLDLMLASPSTYIMAVVRSRRNQRIYSFSNLELNNINLDDGSILRLAEYDNTMRISQCPDLGEVGGLGAILRVALARQAARCGVNLCHAESRTGLTAINVISYHSGMNFGGTLENHLLISGENDIRYDAPSRFQSMNVWYLNGPALESFYG